MLHMLRLLSDQIVLPSRCFHVYSNLPSFALYTANITNKNDTKGPCFAVSFQCPEWFYRGRPRSGGCSLQDVYSCPDGWEKQVQTMGGLVVVFYMKHCNQRYRCLGGCQMGMLIAGV